MGPGWYSRDPARGKIIPLGTVGSREECCRRTDILRDAVGSRGVLAESHWGELIPLETVGSRWVIHGPHVTPMYSEGSHGDFSCDPGKKQ